MVPLVRAIHVFLAFGIGLSQALQVVESAKRHKAYWALEQISLVDHDSSHVPGETAIGKSLPPQVRFSWRPPEPHRSWLARLSSDQPSFLLRNPPSIPRAPPLFVFVH